MRLQDEEGQAVIVVALAMSIFLIGAVGLGVDGSHMYAQRQMAQTAADAGAQAGILSIFDGTNGSGTAKFSTGSSFTCTTTDARTPCAYVAKNGFGSSTDDTVTVDFPDSTAAPGVTLSGSDPTNLIRVTVQRSVNTTLMRLLGPSTSTVKATAMAAIVNVVAPVPILVTHPTLTDSLATNGGVLVTICGGPNRSIQVNSNATEAISTKGSGTINLSKAGPPDPGDCSTGTGADFGTFGGPGSPPFIYQGGTSGHYLQPASPIQDPLADVSAPPKPTNTGKMGTYEALAPNTNGCPASPKKPCQLYYPGLYVGGIDGKNSTPVFKPGIYYIQNGGMLCAANCDMYMATGFTDTGADTTGTGWTGNMLVYNSQTATSPKPGPINIGSNGSISLVGSPAGSAYKGILFFEDHTMPAQVHTMGGGGGLTLLGTIYLNNTLATMKADATHYQQLNLQGTPGSTTYVQGEIIVGVLNMGGNAGITMNLNSNSTLVVRQVAMVN